VIDEADRNLAWKGDKAFLAAGPRLLPFGLDTFILRQHRGETECVIDPHAAMAALALDLAEQLLCGGVMQIDLVLVAHIELDQSQRVRRSGLLDDPPVLPDHIVASQIARSLARDLFALDRSRHGPARVGDEPVDR
jgi:hypothetical protein